MDVRARIETDEDARLAPWASRSRDCSGRLHAEPEHPYRTAFQRDRDRVLHSSAFRRLQYKTQVFVHHEGDHFRSRLTHTLEVAQIGRTLARALGSNEDLTEAIVLAHDLGHTPFGHSGERVLHRLLDAHDGFEHNRQSLRIVDLMERRSEHYDGLNLTHDTRAGILKHGAEYPRYPHPVPLPPLGTSPSVEAQIANRADEIAYHAHDLDDGLRSGLLRAEGLHGVGLWDRARESARAKSPGGQLGDLAAPVIAALIDVLSTDLIETSDARLRASGVTSRAEVQARSEPLIGLSEGLEEERSALAAFLMKNLYRHPDVERMASRAEPVLRGLWEAYRTDPARLPDRTRRGRAGEPPERAVADYLAGMTDRFALTEHERLCGGA
ncbi:MAG: deoxyguanosinetriphosphate triphosphohydrolase [Deltaproteobacteria bacterium]|nr:deoxyguanosinetriphosphate triphosphohydrolase [Deltaproteobacteria bacterium]